MTSATSGTPKVVFPEGMKNISSVIRAKRGKHSVKPMEVYEIIERVYPTARQIELFARVHKVGWDAWGNEVTEIATTAGVASRP